MGKTGRVSVQALALLWERRAPARVHRAQACEGPTGAKKSMMIDQLVPVANTGSRMLLSDARAQIARPKADFIDSSASRRFTLSNICLPLA